MLPENTILHCPTTNLDASIHLRFIGWVHAILAISHSQCAVVFSHNGIAEVLRLTESMQLSTFNLDQQVYNQNGP
jgi:hypothetical protein